ncbi:uncharacterized protein LOC119732468 [Patiria miniata]|uniref:Uncharacterized protein n=1 Tax=Patiria miniata TaxID=46514 RepID=A0A914ADB4_PATMI|nr:uncharacterized protein LOC119732468 [Patiria miniata]
MRAASPLTACHHLRTTTRERTDCKNNIVLDSIIDNDWNYEHQITQGRIWPGENYDGETLFYRDGVGVGDSVPHDYYSCRGTLDRRPMLCSYVLCLGLCNPHCWVRGSSGGRCVRVSSGCTQCQCYT